MLPVYGLLRGDVLLLSHQAFDSGLVYDEWETETRRLTLKVGPEPYLEAVIETWGVFFVVVFLPC